MRTEAKGKFDGIASDFVTEASFGKVAALLSTVRAVVSHQSKLTPEQERSLDSCGDALIGTIINLKELPIEPNKTLTEGFSEAPAMFGELAKAVAGKHEKFNKISTVLKCAMDLYDAHHLMLETEDYQGKLPRVMSLRAALDNQNKLIDGGGQPELAVFTASPFHECLLEFAKRVARDEGKASEVIHEKIDQAYIEKIVRLEAVAGGAPAGGTWWESCSTAAELEEHFKATLDKVNVQQICDLSRHLESAMEDYASKRAAGPVLDRNLERITSALLKARITNMEMVIMRTVGKSKHPVERITTVLSTFDTEEHAAGKATAANCIGEKVKGFLQARYGLLKDAVVPSAPAIAGA